jgi:hypothetical protein
MGRGKTNSGKDYYFGHNENGPGQRRSVIERLCSLKNVLMQEHLVFRDA